MVVSAIDDNEILEAVCVDSANRFYLMLYDVINYYDVIPAANSYESVKDGCFTEVIVEKNVV